MDCTNDHDITKALEKKFADEQQALRIWAWNQFNDLPMSFSCAGGDYCRCQSGYMDASSSLVRTPVYKCPAKSLSPMAKFEHINFMDFEKQLLKGKTRQQYHKDNLKAAKVALQEREERTRRAKCHY